MSKACPNPKSAEWKRLNRQVNLIEAVRTYVAHGYRVPIVDSVPDIKKAIGFRKTVSTRVLTRIKKRIDIFNKHNENSHRLKIDDVGSGTHNIILVLNYQPRNEVMKAMREAAKSDSSIIKVVDSPYGDTQYEELNPEAYQRFLYNQGRTEQDRISDQALRDQEGEEFDRFQQIAKYIEEKDYDKLQKTIDHKLIEDQKTDKLHWKEQKPYIVLSEADSDKFMSYLNKSRGVLPKRFHDEKKGVTYIKSNNRKNSLLYDVVDVSTGEIFREKVRLFVNEEFKSKQTEKSIKEKYGLNLYVSKSFSAKRSISFSLYRQLPSKNKFIAQAKKYLYDALKLQNLDITGEKAHINLNAIDELLSMFPDEMWKYINTTYSFERSNAINASTSIANNIGFALPKLGMIKSLEKEFNIDILNKSIKNYDTSGSIGKHLGVGWGDDIVIDNKLTNKQLRIALSYYLHKSGIIKKSSTNRNIEKFAEHFNYDIKELRQMLFNDQFGHDSISFNQTGESDTMALSKWRDSVRNYDWQTAELFSKQEKDYLADASTYVSEKFKDKLLPNGETYLDYFFSGNFNWININFNSISGVYHSLDEIGEPVAEDIGIDENPITGFKTVRKPSASSYLESVEAYNRLASVLHEPFHALHALTYGSTEEKQMRIAFDNLVSTKFGKELLQTMFPDGYNNRKISNDTTYKEFMAFAFQLINYPKSWVNKTDLRSNDMYEFIEKIQTLQDKTYDEIIKTRINASELSDEEVLKLNFLEKLYNLFIEALNKLHIISKSFADVSKISGLTTKSTISSIEATDEANVITKDKVPRDVLNERKKFLDAMDELSASIDSLMDIDSMAFSSDNISSFFKESEQEKGEDLLYNLQNIESLSTEEKIVNLDRVLSFLDDINVPIELTEFGDNPIMAVSNFTKGVIQIAEEIEKRPSAWNAVPEEAAHWWYRLLKDEEYKTALRNAVTSTDEYKKVLSSDEYKDVYDNNLLEEEAIGKVIGNIIKRVEQGNATKEELSLWDKFVNLILSVFKNERNPNDLFIDAAYRIINSDLTDLMTTEEYAEVNGYVYGQRDSSTNIDGTIPDSHEVSSVEPVDENPSYAEKLLGGTYRRRTRFLKKTFDKLVSIYTVGGSNHGLQKKKLSKNQKNQLEKHLRYKNVVPTLESFNTLEKKFSKNPVPLNKNALPTKLFSRTDVEIYSDVIDLIKKENPKLKSIKVGDFINEVIMFLEHNYMLGFAYEKGQEKYKVKDTFKNYQGIEHQKISLRFNDEYVDKFSHFPLSATAWGNLTPYENGVLLHEIQSDFYEDLVKLHKEGASKEQKAKIALQFHNLVSDKHFNYSGVFQRIIDRAQSEEVFPDNIIEIVRGSIDESQHLLARYGDVDEDISKVYDNIDTILRTTGLMTDAIKRKGLKIVTDEEVAVYKQRIRTDKEYNNVTLGLDQYEYGPEDLSTLAPDFKRNLALKFIEKMKSIGYHDFNEKQVLDIIMGIQFFNEGYVNNVNLQESRSHKGLILFARNNLNFLYGKQRKIEFLARLDALSDEDLYSVAENVYHNVRRLKNEAIIYGQEKYSDELSEKAKPIQSVSTEWTRIELGYFTPLVHHLIQTYLLSEDYKNGKPLIFSGAQITSFSQVDIQGKTSRLYAGPEEVKKGLASRVGALYIRMSKINGIKLRYVENLEGFTQPTGGYIVDLSNYKYKAPLLENLAKNAIKKNEEEKVRLESSDQIVRQAPLVNPVDEDDELPFQLSANKEQSNAKIDAKVEAFLHKLGFKIDSTKQIYDKDGNPIDATAKVDMINKLVQVADGKRGIDTLPEEAAHILTLLLRDNGDPLFDELVKDIENTEEYAQVKEEYADVYGDNESLYRLEAVGKIIAKRIIDAENRSFIKRILDAIKKFFGKTMTDPFQRAAFMILNSDTAKLSPRNIKSTEELFQLTRDEISAKFDKTTADLTLVDVEVSKQPPRVYRGLDKIKERYIDTTRDWLIGNRVTDKQDAAWISSQGSEKRAVEKRNEARSVVMRETGTRLHKASADLTEYILDGSKDASKLSSIKDESKLNDRDFKKLHKGVAALVQQAKDIQKEIDPTKEARFHIGQIMYDEGQDMAGSADMIVLFSDSSAAIYDYKFKSFHRYNSTTSSGERVLTNKIVGPEASDSYDLQMYDYVDIAKRIYGITNVRQSRVVPIVVDYYKDKKTDTITDTVIQLEMGADTSQFLEQVPLADELPSLEELHKITKTLFDLKEKLRYEFKQEKDVDKKHSLKERLAAITESINTIQLKGDVSLLLNDIYTIMKSLYGTRANPGSLFTNNDPESEDFITDRYLKEIQQELLMYHDAVLNAEHYIEGLADKPELQKKSERALHDLYFQIDISSQMVSDKLKERAVTIARDVDEDITKPGRELNWIERNFQSMAKIQHPVMRAAYKYIDTAQTNIRNSRNKVYEEMGVLTKNIMSWGNANGYRGSKVYSLLLEGEEKMLAREYKESLYDKINSSIESGDIDWLRKHFDPTQKFLSKVDARRRNEWRRIQLLYPDTKEIGTDKDVSRADVRDQKMLEWEKRNNPIHDGFWLLKKWTPQNIELKEQYREQYRSDKYKFIRANKPLKDFYDYYMTKNKEFAFIAGLESIPENFVANIQDSVIGSIMLGDNKIAKASRALVNSVSVYQDGVMGAVDPLTGEKKNEIPIMYKRPLYNDQGEVDYSNKSLDLAKVLLLFADSVYNFEEKKEIEVQVMALRDYLAYSETGEYGTTEADKLRKSRLGRLIKSPTRRNTLAVYDMFVKYHLYGQRIQSKDKHIKAWGKVLSKNKIIRGLITYHSVKVLGLAVIPPIAAGIAGRFNLAFEATKGANFTKKDVRAAEKDLLKRDHIAAMIPKYFEVFQEDMLYRRAANLSVGKTTKYLTLNNMFRGFSFADEKLDFVTINAMTRTHGLDADGNVDTILRIEDRNKAAGITTKVKSIRELTSIVNDKLVIEGFEQKQYQQFRNRARYIGGSIKGQMSSDDLATFNMTMLGASIMQFRSWLPALLEERFGNLRYVEATRSLQQGRYTVFAKEIFTSDKEIGELGVSIGKRMLQFSFNLIGFRKALVRPDRARYEFEKWRNNNQNDPRLETMTVDDYMRMREGQLKAMVAEMRAALLIMALVMFMGMDWDGDDEKEYKRFWATRKLRQVLKRAYSELAVFYSPGEIKNWFSTPVPVVGLGLDIGRAFANFWDELLDAVFDRSDSHDKTPWGYYTIDFIPGIDKLSGTFELGKQDKIAER
jgi:hypothetical protein